ncbi:MAG: hypothetical protein ACFB0E_14090, partial [Leptolyngbyaceae cyanobacterium]
PPFRSAFPVLPGSPVRGRLAGASCLGASGAGRPGLGGAIFLHSGRLLLNRTEFEQNAAIAGRGAHPGQGKGGAIFNWSDPGTSGSDWQIISFGDPPHFLDNTAPEAAKTAVDNINVFGSLVTFGHQP